MEDENGLDLSLGLSCGGSSVKPKNKNGNSANTRAEEARRSGKMIHDLKSIFDAGPQKPDSVTGEQTIDFSKPEENFFSDLSEAKEENASLNLNGRGFWVADSDRPIESEEDKRLETANKRKMSFDELNHQKKHGSDVHYADLDEKARTSHISILKDGLAAVKEDVADSEAENCTSRPITHHGDGHRQPVRGGFSSDAAKDVCGVAESSATDFNGEKRFTGVMHVMPIATGECTGAQPASNGSVMFGYPSVQLPMLDKDNSWGLASRPQQLHLSFVGRGPPNAAASALSVIANDIYETMPYEGRPLERSKEMVNNLPLKLAPPHSLKMQREAAQTSRRKDGSNQEGSAIDSSVIKPGLAANVKFGGAGSCPNLPWLSTIASGPNGRKISGVPYRYSTNEIRIVCACHGSHMNPEEFVRHANEDYTRPESSTILGKVANGNFAASVHSWIIVIFNERIREIKLYVH